MKNEAALLLAPPDLNEPEPRYSLINPQLEKAGWNPADHTKVGFEIPVQNYDKSHVTGFTDYCLYRANGEVLAVVEAKSTNRYPCLEKEHALHFLILNFIYELQKK